MLQDAYKGAYTLCCNQPKGLPGVIETEYIITTLPGLTERGRKIPKNPDNFQHIIKQRIANWNHDIDRHDNITLTDEYVIQAQYELESTDEELREARKEIERLKKPKEKKKQERKKRKANKRKR
jgi:hypothetical protein